MKALNDNSIAVPSPAGFMELTAIKMEYDVFCSAKTPQVYKLQIHKQVCCCDVVVTVHNVSHTNYTCYWQVVSVCDRIR